MGAVYRYLLGACVLCGLPHSLGDSGHVSGYVGTVRGEGQQGWVLRAAREWNLTQRWERTHLIGREGN